MNRVCLLFAGIVLPLQLLCNPLAAAPVTAFQAEKAVKGWLKIDNTPLETAMGPRIAAIETYTDETGEPLYHIVYLQPRGFVIVSADDRIEPIIGFVEKGMYDPSVDNPLGALVTNDLHGRMAALEAGRPAQIRIDAKSVVDPQTKWNDLTKLGEEPDNGYIITGIGTGEMDEVRIAPLIETEWDQGTAPFGQWCYNKYTPNHYLCGCVATALAQIMRYYEYPDTGIGTDSFSIKVDDTIESWDTRGGDGSGSVYDWANMVSIPGMNPTDTQLTAIGSICYDAGVGISNLCSNQYTNYKSDVTIAYTCCARAGLTSTFNYGNAIYGYSGGSSSSIPTANRNKMINPNLDGGHPVYLGIWKTGSSYGHAIVCDGYGYDGGTLYHHLNMGWGGDYNAWYNLPTIDSSPDYNTVYETIYNIRPSLLNNGEMISGRVFDPNGVPLANPFVYADPVEPPMWIPCTKSWTNGIYAFDNLASNKTYQVHPLITGYAFTSREVATGTSTNTSTTVGNVWEIDFYGDLLTITRITPSAGPIGSYIKIEGQNFGSSAGAVLFGGGGAGQEAQWSDTIIYCRVPGNAQSGNVQITTAESDLSYGKYFEVTRPDTIYIDDDALEIQNGTPEYPLSSIQTGIQAVAENGTVVVNPGTYYENINFSGRIITVTSLDPTDPNTVIATIIDGGQNGRVVTFENKEDPNCLLSGFTITHGSSTDNGGGIYCGYSSPVIQYCMITDNTVSESRMGGGLYCLYSTATVAHCTISGNRAGYGGAGMYNQSCNPVIADCTFSKNSTTDDYTYGGGIFNYGSSPKLIRCMFFANKATVEGGGVYNNSGSSPLIAGCIFTANSADDKAAFPAGDNGGAVSSDSNSHPTLMNCLFRYNTAGSRGGAVYSFFAQLTLSMTNCIFVGNSTTKTGSDGGAIYNSDGGTTITNCTFSGNFAVDKGGAIYNHWNNYGNDNTVVNNCILWNNGMDEIYDYYSTTEVNYTNIKGGWPSGTGNLNADPLFIDPDGADPNLRDFRLQPDSPCIDSGDNTALPSDIADLDNDGNTAEVIPQDLDGRDRVADGDCDQTAAVDMGAYEFSWVYLGDFDGQCDVDYGDLCILASTWLLAEPETGYNPNCDIGRPPDGLINMEDLEILSDNWLSQNP